MNDENSKEKTAKFTFFSKKAIECPLCDAEFHREDLFSGGGRLIAGNLSMDLRRNYLENKKYGVVIPMIYTVTVCPDCYYAALSEDFPSAGKSKEKLDGDRIKRLSMVNDLFPGIDYKQERNIEHGLLSYILAIDCYKYFDKKLIPTLKRGICSLRASWICDDLYRNYDKPVFASMQKIFHRKAAKYYGMALNYSQNGTEPYDGQKYIGPDTDNNFGYDGFLYLAGYLNYLMADNDSNVERKGKTYLKIKRIMGKLYGGGKASKDKPTIILNNAKDLYDEIKDKIKEIEGELGKSFD